MLHKHTQTHGRFASKCLRHSTGQHHSRNNKVKASHCRTGKDQIQKTGKGTKEVEGRQTVVCVLERVCRHGIELSSVQSLPSFSSFGSCNFANPKCLWRSLSILLEEHNHQSPLTTHSHFTCKIANSPSLCHHNGCKQLLPHDAVPWPSTSTPP